MQAVALDIETGPLEDALNINRCKITITGLASEETSLLRTNLPPDDALIRSLFPPENHILITWNGTKFDLPALEKHGYGLRDYKHLDLLPVVRRAMPGLRSYTKDNVCRYLGIYCPRVLSAIGCALAATNSNLIDDPQLSIMQHNHEDLIATLKIYDRLERAGMLENE